MYNKLVPPSAFAVVLFLSSFSAFATDREAPEKLKKILTNSLGDQYTTVHWSMENRFKDGFSVKQNLVSHYAAGTVLQKNTGNDEGVHENTLRSMQLTQGELSEYRRKALENVLHGTVNSLFYDDHVWVHFSGDPQARVSEPQNTTHHPIVNPILGASKPVGGPHFDGGSEPQYGIPFNLWKKGTETTFKETSRGSVSVIDMEYPLGEKKVSVRWELDRNRGELPVACTLSIDGKPIYASKAELEAKDGVWFTKSIDFYDYTNPPELQNYYSVTIKSIGINDDTLPRSGFTPDDIPLGFPHVIYKEGVQHQLYWDGVSFITMEERNELLYLAGMEPHPAFVATACKAKKITEDQYYAQLEESRTRHRKDYLKKHGHEYVVDVFTPTKPGEKDKWDVYVDEFIKKHDLKGDVVQEMLSFRDECKRQRDWYRRNHKKYQEESAEKGDDRKLKAMDEHVDRIFNKRLKPGLESLRRKASS